MHSLTFEDHGVYPVCLLINDLRQDEIIRHYLDPFGIPKGEFMALTMLQAPGKKKVPVALMKQYIIEELVPVWNDAQTNYILVTDSEYFKVLTGAKKVDAALGYVLKCLFGDQHVIYVPSYKMIFYDPVKTVAKIQQAKEALLAHVAGEYQDPGTDVVQFEYYPKGETQIKKMLDELLRKNCDLTCDIEAFDLKHHKSGIGTITFCWNKHEGIAFAVDYEPIPGATEAPYGRNVRNDPIRQLLIDFFIAFGKTKRKMIYHNIAFDAYALIYQLFMKDILDTEGMLTGFGHMLKNWECTKLISYLATNSCAGNKLGLKDQAQDFAGDYAEAEIKDITKIPYGQLLRYNLIDGLSTWHVYDKRFPQMVTDDQLGIYRELFQPSTLDIIQMQLTGLPVNMAEVVRVKAIMQGDFDVALDRINRTKVAAAYNAIQNQEWVDMKNATLKKKRVTLADAKEVFNPGSPLQLQGLLYKMLELPVLDTTDTGQPSTNAKTLKALKNHTKDPDILEFLDALLDLASVSIILNTFIPAFENAALGPDGWHYLFGNFNLGGTVSGRLSSSKPNLQNIPAGSKYAKLIKQCVQAPPGWIFVGLDFASVEDRISALTTRDPEKLKVYTEGYDGHCLRAYAYFKDQMPDIDPSTVEGINEIAKKYKSLRNLSKAPTFALTYQGTWATLMKNCGFDEKTAKGIEDNFKLLYDVSIKWVNAKLDEASKRGYITAAFGLRVRTPMLHQVVRGNSKTPKAAEAEGRTAGNALGQSWCLLNSRAWNEFMGKVRTSEFKYDIRPCAQIHDAGYALIREDLRAVAYTNKHLVEAVNWNNHPDIYHPDVGLGGELSIFYPNWSNEIVLKNGADEQAIYDKCAEALEEYQ